MKTLQVRLSDQQHQTLKVRAVSSGQTMTDYVLRKTDLLESVPDVSNVAEVESCVGHTTMRLNCGLQGCKY